MPKHGVKIIIVIIIEAKNHLVELIFYIEILLFCSNDVATL